MATYDKNKVESAIGWAVSKFPKKLSDLQVASLQEFGLVCLGGSQKWPFLYGNAGSGKTTVARIMATAGTMLDLKPKVSGAVELTLSAQQDTRNIIQTGNHDGLLVIDDLGISGWSVKSYGTDIPVMDYVIMLRYELFLRGTGTIITSNIPFDKLGDYLSEQAHDRCREMFKPIAIITKSYRGENNSGTHL